MKDFLDLADLGRDEVLELLALARRLEAHPEPHALAGKILGLVFFNPSLRTLASFQVGMQRLGGSSFVITPGQGTWQLETRLGAVMDGDCAEHIREGLPVLASYADALGIRAFAAGKDLAEDVAETRFKAMAAVVDKPLINLESAMSHPCQSLADWKTMDDLVVPQRAKFVLSWANHPRVTPLAVPASTLHMAAHRGMEVVVLRPDGFALPPEVMDKARTAAASVPNSKIGPCARIGSPGRSPTASSCTACRCGAMSPSPTRCSTARAASCSARPTTACPPRWRCCTACSPDRLLA